MCIYVWNAVVHTDLATFADSLAEKSLQIYVKQITRRHADMSKKEISLITVSEILSCQLPFEESLSKLFKEHVLSVTVENR